MLNICFGRVTGNERLANFLTGRKTSVNFGFLLADFTGVEFALGFFVYKRSFAFGPPLL